MQEIISFATLMNNARCQPKKCVGGKYFFKSLTRNTINMKVTEECARRVNMASLLAIFKARLQGQSSSGVWQLGF